METPQGHKEVFLIGIFKNMQIYIELRPQCPKCKKEFMLDLKKFLPGRAHSCHACGTVAQFDGQLAEKVQKLIHDLESSICEVHESFVSEKAG
jgi:hypothetical protein